MSSASAVAPPRPGSAPKMRPMPMPRLRNISSRTCSRPSTPATHASNNMAETISHAAVARMSGAFLRQPQITMKARRSSGDCFATSRAPDCAAQATHGEGLYRACAAQSGLHASIRREILLPFGEEIRLAVNVGCDLVGRLQRETDAGGLRQRDHCRIVDGLVDRLDQNLLDVGRQVRRCADHALDQKIGELRLAERGGIGYVLMRTPGREGGDKAQRLARLE